MSVTAPSVAWLSTRGRGLDAWQRRRTLPQEVDILLSEYHMRGMVMDGSFTQYISYIATLNTSRSRNHSGCGSATGVSRVPRACARSDQFVTISRVLFAVSEGATSDHAVSRCSRSRCLGACMTNEGRKGKAKIHQANNRTNLPYNCYTIRFASGRPRWPQ